MAKVSKFVLSLEILLCDASFFPLFWSNKFSNKIAISVECHIVESIWFESDPPLIGDRRLKIDSIIFGRLYFFFFFFFLWLNKWLESLNQITLFIIFQRDNCMRMVISSFLFPPLSAGVFDAVVFFFKFFFSSSCVCCSSVWPLNKSDHIADSILCKQRTLSFAFAYTFSIQSRNERKKNKHTHTTLLNEWPKIFKIVWYLVRTHSFSGQV